MGTKASNKLSPHTPELSKTGPRLKRGGTLGDKFIDQKDPFAFLKTNLSKGGVAGLGKIHRPTVVAVKPDHDLYRKASENENID